MEEGAAAMEGGVCGRRQRRVSDRHRRRIRTSRQEGGGEEELRGIPRGSARAAGECRQGEGEDRAARAATGGKRARAAAARCDERAAAAFRGPQFRPEGGDRAGPPSAGEVDTTGGPGSARAEEGRRQGRRRRAASVAAPRRRTARSEEGRGAGSGD